MLLGDELAELAARERLDAALEQADANREHPELGSAAQEERREQRDQKVREHGDEQHLLRAETPRKAPVGDCRGECHELRDQKRQHKVRRADAQVGAVTRGHRDNRVHAVDVEEKRQHEHHEPAVVENLLARSHKARNRVLEQMLLARLVVRLVHVAPDGNAERKPPHRRDDERDADAVKLPDPEVLAEQHEYQADDERHARPDVSPGVPLRRHLVVALLARCGVHEEGVVEHERRVQHDRRHHIDHEEHHRVGGNAHNREGHRARADGAGEKLLLVALQIGEATEERHEQRQHKRSHRRSVAPGHNRRRVRVGNR